MRATLKANLSKNAKKTIEPKNRRMMSVTVKDKAPRLDGSDMVMPIGSTAASNAYE